LKTKDRKFFRYLLLTYHDDNWVFSLPVLEDGSVVDSLDALTEYCKKWMVCSLLWKTLILSSKKLCDRHGVPHNTLALEICPKTLSDKRLLRLHVHLVVDWDGFRKSMYDINSLCLLGKPPAQTQGTAPQEERSRNNSSAPMHYYLQMAKPGQIAVSTNHVMFHDFSVNPRWVTKWLQLGKIKWDTAEKHYVYCTANCSGNLKNLTCFTNKMKEFSMVERKQHIQSVLLSEQKPFQTDPEMDSKVAAFLAQFQAPRSRCSFLVLTGKSRTGKTRFAKWLFGDEKNCHVTNCAAATEPDLRHFDWMTHKSILCDECKPMTVIRQKQLFQGPPDEVLLATSATNIESYSVFVSGIAITICSNDWRVLVGKLELEEDQDWLGANSIVCDITHDLY
jgi:hypothetical protein